MRLFLLALLLVGLSGCTVRGGWPRFLRPGESPGWSGPKPDKIAQEKKDLFTVVCPDCDATNTLLCVVEASKSRSSDGWLIHQEVCFTCPCCRDQERQPLADVKRPFIAPIHANK